jgi:two-component system, OmpR family, alkaline phosphatase synthesis response regulator PhoP
MIHGGNTMDINKSILIVEDDNNLQAIYQQKLKSEGFTVYQALTGQQALTLAKEKKPDLILLDIMLPEGMNGFDVFEQIKLDNNLVNVPVIVFTNLDSERDTALAMGAADYMVKANTSIDDLVVKVKSHLNMI